MKRIFNGRYERLPQVSTLNAITIFLGYNGGWQEFKTKKLYDEVIVPHSKEAEEIPLEPAQSSKNKAYIFRSVGAIGVLLILFFVFFNSKNSTNKLHEDFEIAFSTKKIVKKGVPNTVVFNYNIDDVPGDSFFIQQTWDVNRRVKISKNKYTLTDIYFEPGHHKAKLIANGRILRETPIEITTEGWLSYAKDSFFEHDPIYIKSEKFINNGLLGLSSEKVIQSGIDFNKDQLYFYSFCPGTFKINSDDLKLRARVRVGEIKNSLCPWVITELICENSFLFFTNTRPGCSSDINAMFGGEFIDGKTNDLSSFSCDVMQWQDIELTIKNKVAVISINGNPIYKKAYQNSSGMVSGVGFVSNGLSEVDFVELQDGNGKVVYRDDFND
jgi:hypothetical protein